MPQEKIIYSLVFLLAGCPVLRAQSEAPLARCDGNVIVAAYNILWIDQQDINKLPEVSQHFDVCSMLEIKKENEIRKLVNALETKTRMYWGVFGVRTYPPEGRYAEQGMLVVHVANPQERPIRGVVLSTKGDGSTGPATDDAGKTRIRLAPDTKPGSWVSLQIVVTPENQDLVFVSPWNGRAPVPPFVNESENFIPVVLIARGSKQLLQNPKILAERINVELSPKTATEEMTEERRLEALALIASEYGLDGREIDLAIRSWGEKTTDPYEKGLAELYEENFPEASRHLATALESREQAEAEAIKEVVDAATFLGQSLYREGRYREAAEAFRKASARSEDDADILNDFALAPNQSETRILFALLGLKKLGRIVRTPKRRPHKTHAPYSR